jgi:CHASE3 domain sensor protein
MSEKKEVRIIADEEVIQTLKGEIAKMLDEKLASLKPKEEERKSMSIEEVAKHIASCPECSKPLNEMISERFNAFKSEIEKVIEEKVKALAKEEVKNESRRGWLW